MIYILAILVVVFLMYDKHTKSDEVDGSKYFYISDGDSKAMYVKMHADGVSSDRLKNFLLMEDEFLSMEQQSVCTGIPLIIQAGVLSNKIKETFPKYDFSYHTIHLKQIAEPNKQVNTKIKC